MIAAIALALLVGIFAYAWGYANGAASAQTVPEPPDNVVPITSADGASLTALWRDLGGEG